MSFQLRTQLSGRRLDVELSLEPGETLAVLGPNGAGKSTLLAIVAGLLRPDSGRAVLDGRVLFELDGGTRIWRPPHRRGTALLAQEALLFPHLDALDNVAFGPRSSGSSRAEARTAARHWLAQVDASALERRRPGELSGGQAQRIAVARALAAAPDLLLLDEPFSALDVHTAPLLRRLLKTVLSGRRAILVTHNVLDAYLLADRVVILEDGRITDSGPTRKVLGRPRSSFAAGLAGLNILSGTGVSGGLRTAEGHLISGRWEGEPAPEAVAAFPPSAVSVYLERPHGSPRNVFTAVVSELEPHGDQIRVRAGGLSADITPASAADLALAPGTPVHFVVKAAEVTVYPA